MQVANVEGAMRVASIRRVADLVENRPQESLAVLRGWLTPEGN